MNVIESSIRHDHDVVARPHLGGNVGHDFLRRSECRCAIAPGTDSFSVKVQFTSVPSSVEELLVMRKIQLPLEP